MKLKTLSVTMVSVLLALSAVSCNKKNVKNADERTDMTTDTAADPSMNIQENSDTTSTEGDIRSGNFVSQETILSIYFDFDVYGLSEGTRKTLQKNAAILKTHKDWVVLVEGYCDSRGTVGYNLSLGQKRAIEVRSYYIRLGVPEASIGTISYGKEKPSCEEETDECWAKNRKAETKVKAR